MQGPLGKSGSRQLGLSRGPRLQECPSVPTAEQGRGEAQSRALAGGDLLSYHSRNNDHRAGFAVGTSS